MSTRDAEKSGSQRGGIDDETRAMQPLIDEAGMRMRLHLLQHPHAPRWNHIAGDRIGERELKMAHALRAQLRVHRPAAEVGDGVIPEHIAQWVNARRSRVPLFAERIPRNLEIRAAFAEIPTMSREDLALRPEALIADDASLDEMICYRTAGTTGHPLLVPHHASATGAYPIYLEHALERCGVTLDPRGDNVTCLLIGAQKHTVTYPCVLSVWNQTGFAKINLNGAQWKTPADRKAFLQDCAAQLYTGDPLSFAELMHVDDTENIGLKPRALISTAVAMSTALKTRLQSHFGCPVIDWYSLTETGPLGYWQSDADAYRVLPHDVYVEAVDESGQPVADGQRGEITVTGGRNPYIPLLRYRTGDWGRIERLDTENGRATFLFDLEGRAPVLFRAHDGSMVNPVDLSKILRRFPLVQHTFEQHADKRCVLTVRALKDSALAEEAIAKALTDVLGDLRIDIVHDENLGERKVAPYKSALLLE